MTTGGNGNVSGNSEDRRRRRAWLVETYRADVDVITVSCNGVLITEAGPMQLRLVETFPHRYQIVGEPQPACRCYRCGTLCTIYTVTVDRIIPGALGGTYRRNNIRPACSDCNNKTGGKLGASRVKRKSKKPKGWLSVDPVL